MFGLGCQKDGRYSRKVVCLDNEGVDQFLSKYAGKKVLLCHCAVESLNDDIGLKIGQKINGKYESYSNIATPNDCVTVFHVLRYVSHCSDVAISLNDCGLTDEPLKELIDILSNADGELQVRELSFYRNRITDKGIADLFNRASSSFLL